MWNQCLVLVSAAFLLSSHAQQLSNNKFMKDNNILNSVYYASMGGFNPTQSTLDRDESSKEVLKELGVDLSNEGKVDDFYLYL